MKKLLLPLLLILCVPLMGDEKEDFTITKLLAIEGLDLAQFKLGVCYQFGKGVEKDLKEAVKWYRKSAEQGNAAAQHNLGLGFHLGRGVLEDFVTAYAWYNIAATNGSKNAKDNKAILAKKMTPEQIAKAQELSKEMVKKNSKLISE